MTENDTRAINEIANILNEHEQWSSDEIEAVAAVLDAVRPKPVQSAGVDWPVNGPGLDWQGSRYVVPTDGQGACILSEADILAGRDDDCSTHGHEDA